MHNLEFSKESEMNLQPTTLFCSPYLQRERERRKEAEGINLFYLQSDMTFILRRTCVYVEAESPTSFSSNIFLLAPVTLCWATLREKSREKEGKECRDFWQRCQTEVEIVVHTYPVSSMSF